MLCLGRGWRRSRPQQNKPTRTQFFPLIKNLTFSSRDAKEEHFSLPLMDVTHFTLRVVNVVTEQSDHIVEIIAAHTSSGRVLLRAFTDNKTLTSKAKHRVPPRRRAWSELADMLINFLKSESRALLENELERDFHLVVDAADIFSLKARSKRA